jgi:signal transduction histidine kinase
MRWRWGDLHQHERLVKPDHQHPLRHRHAGWFHRFKHSLRWRLVALFLLLAMAMSAAFVGGMQKAFSVGWREAARPLLVDYIDRLAADLGSPPDPARAQALVARLPISVRIEGPLTRFDSHPKKHDERWQLTAVAYAYVRRLLKPLDDIGAGARRFGAGDFARPIPVRRNDELGDLAGQINTMGHDIQQMLDAKRALLLAISHELRSPLTRARLNTELLPETPDTQEPREALLRDLVEMGRLITDLLESERLTSRHAALNLESTDLAQLVREVVDEHNAGQGEPGQVPILVAIAPGLPLLPLDRIRARLLLRNLLDNARRYSTGTSMGDSTPLVEVNLSRQGDALHLTVRDHGPGVDDAQLPHLTEPFFRTDTARQRTTGGMGLGLYLCRLVAQAHGGSLLVRNAAPGLEVTVTLPLLYY